MLKVTPCPNEMMTNERAKWGKMTNQRAEWGHIANERVTGVTRGMYYPQEFGSDAL